MWEYSTFRNSRKHVRLEKQFSNANKLQVQTTTPHSTGIKVIARTVDGSEVVRLRTRQQGCSESSRQVISFQCLF